MKGVTPGFMSNSNYRSKFQRRRVESATDTAFLQEGLTRIAAAAQDRERFQRTIRPGAHLH